MKRAVARLWAAWRALALGLDQRAAVERVVLCAVVLGVVWLVLDGLWLGALQTAIRTEKSRLSQTQTQWSEVSTQHQVLALLQHHDPDQAMKSRLDQLKSEWDTYEARWTQARLKLLSPEQSIPMLADLLQTLPALEKLEWTVLPVQAAGPGADAAAAVVAAEAPAPAVATTGTPTTAVPRPLLWRQSVRLRVRGSYADVARYMRLLEALPYRVQCDKLLLSTPVDPASPHRVTATLLISTLSFEDRWLAF